MAFLDAVERGADGVDVARFPAACDRDEGAVGQVRLVGAVLAGAQEIRASMAAAVSFAVWLTCEPRRGRQVEPVSVR